MAISSRSYARPYVSGSGLPPGVKALLIANCVIFLIQFLARGSLDTFLQTYFGLVPALVISKLFIWQVVTYMFLHGGILHIVFNMLALWWFGSDLEGAWGTEKFLRFYFLVGILAGVCVVIANYFWGNPNIPTIGASGAIYGILAAAAVLWPDRIILMIIFPLKLKYFVMIAGAIAFYNSFSVNSPVSDIAHLSGLLFGYLLMKMPSGRRVSVTGWVRDAYKDWKLQRAKKKFQVYLRKQGRGGPFVN
jgi:membrane associated rhomboid family serine protease